MNKRSPTTRRATLYRLVRRTTIGDCIQAKYIDGLAQREITVAGVDALLAYREITTNRASWNDSVLRLTSIDPSLGNSTAAGVLLMAPTDRWFYAITYGMGHLLLEPHLLDQGFGLLFAIRTVGANEISEVTRHRMDHRARIERSSTPGGESIAAFGIEEYGEIVSRLAGRVHRVTLTAFGEDTVERGYVLRASDSMSFPLAVEPPQLVHDLVQIERVIDMDPPEATLEFVARVQPLKRGDARGELLNERLAQSFDADTMDTRPVVAYPWEYEAEQGTAESFRLLAGRWRSDPSTEPPLMELRSLIAPLAAEARVKCLERWRIQSFSDPEGTEVNGRAIPAIRWLAYETILGHERYFLHQGRWYSLDQRYVEFLHERAANVLAQRSAMTLPRWHSSEYERAYNERAAREVNGFLCLDRKLVQTSMHPKGFEVCDLLGPGGELLHVKRLDSSVSASHLFAQAMVSAEQLTYESEARRQFDELVKRVSGNTRSWEGAPRRVVLVFGGPRQLDVDSFFTFSQVMLVRCHERLGRLGVSTEVAVV